jgi:hypothetical protein
VTLGFDAMPSLRAVACPLSLGSHLLSEQPSNSTALTSQSSAASVILSAVLYRQASVFAGLSAVLHRQASVFAGVLFKSSRSRHRCAPFPPRLPVTDWRAQI